MRWLLIALILFAAATGTAVLLGQYPGYVYLEVGQWTVQTTLAFTVIAVIVVFIVVYAILRAIGLLARAPRRLRRGKHGRRTERSRRGLTRGLIEMSEGRWNRAERLLTRHAPDSDTALLHYLSAARAAQHAGAHERRDRYLKAAIEANPEADVAVSLTQAELQLAHHQTEHALATLTRLQSLAPHHSHGLKLLARLYRDTEDWSQLGQLVPELRNRRALTAETIDDLERTATRGRLATDEPDAGELRALWDGLSKRMRDDPDIVLAFSRRQIDIDGHETAEKRLRHTLGRHWDERLARVYGQVRAPDTDRQIQLAEGWLKEHAHSPMLLLTLGRLCARQQLWARAREYLESSLAVEARAETRYQLASLLDDLGESEAAKEQYRCGLALAVADSAAMMTDSDTAMTSIMAPPDRPTDDDNRAIPAPPI